ncbi:DUF4256 domain-containing protein [bacterium]|nr:DUF4256 domain-containing protein [bacterium]
MPAGKNGPSRLSEADLKKLLLKLRTRFMENPSRHPELAWSDVEARIISNPVKANSLNAMESTGGDPDVVGFDKSTEQFIFFDCSPESPDSRRSLCYDQKALQSRKENKPKSSAMEFATAIGIELLTEEQYRYLQTLGHFDTKTSSWVRTPESIRNLGGAIFCDYRFGRVFTYHNGAESYYAARGFRGVLSV